VKREIVEYLLTFSSHSATNESVNRISSGVCFERANGSRRKNGICEIIEIVLQRQADCKRCDAAHFMA
jgi:hypothetical protein